MICRYCAQAADWDRDYEDGHLPVNRTALVAYPEHCDDPTCTCQHKPVKPKEKSK